MNHIHYHCDGSCHFPLAVVSDGTNRSDVQFISTWRLLFAAEGRVSTSKCQRTLSSMEHAVLADQTVNTTHQDPPIQTDHGATSRPIIDPPDDMPGSFFIVTHWRNGKHERLRC